jgi:hypothetical protein
MAPEATPQPGGIRPSPSVNALPSPATPGLWLVSHSDVRSAGAAHRAGSSGERSGLAPAGAAGNDAFDLVVDVSFVWSYPAKFAFVTGTFGNWETTEAMTKVTSSSAITAAAGGDGGDGGEYWVLSKALPPGDHQYKCKSTALSFAIARPPKRVPTVPVTVANA